MTDFIQLEKAGFWLDCGAGFLGVEWNYVTGYVIYRMANKAKDEKDVRKLTKVGGKSIAVTLPIELVRELGWREKQKVVVSRVRGGILIKDWKK